jgi:hypothetical protein
MAIEEIDWNVPICASTYAELGEAWATLRLINAQLEEPDGGRVLNESGAAGPYRAAHELVAGALRGLDQFLGIQWNYLEGIRRDVHIDLTELKNIRGDKDPTPGEIRVGAATLAGSQSLIPPTGRQAGRSPATPDFASGEIYPGLFAFETPPNWLTGWLQYVAYAGSPAQPIPTVAPWTEQVPYAGF